MIEGPSTRELLIARLAFVRQDLDEILGRLTQEMMDWAPGPGVRTIAGQLVEIAETEYEATAWLTEGRIVSDAEAEAEFGDCGSLKNLSAHLLSIRGLTLKALDAFTDAQLEEVTVLRKPWFGMAGLPKAPRAEFFRSIALHEHYHVGQLVTYLWARGDNPYKW